MPGGALEQDIQLGMENMHRHAEDLELSEGTDRLSRLAAYSLAAASAVGAAGVASGEIVYFGGSGISISSGGFLQFDVNQDSLYDFKLKNYANAFGSYESYMGAEAPFLGGKFVGFTSVFSYISALSAGATIDSTTTNVTLGSMAFGPQNPNAQFNTANSAYMGFAFGLGATPDIHYGWARVTINQSQGLFSVEDWAYENQAGVGIQAGAIPEPGTLGLLAAGALGLTQMRNRRAAVLK